MYDHQHCFIQREWLRWVLFEQIENYLQIYEDLSAISLSDAGLEQIEINVE